jgi:NAD-dependent dihydropyrimidine dehydrogenase PreA subunit
VNSNYGHPDEIDLKEAEDFGKRMVETSRRIAAGETDLIPPAPDFALTHQLLVLTEFYRYGGNPHGYMKYDSEKCIYPKCSLCMDNCLMNYIDLSASPPVFGSKKTECDMWMGCTFCEMICPTGAISCDWEEFSKKFRSIIPNFGYNPLAKAAEEAIASGRLRMLVPKEEVRPDRPHFKVHEKRPRFRIPKDK